MDKLLQGLATTLVCFLPLIFALGILFWQVSTRNARQRYPLQGTMPRPPGESSRLQIEELNDQLILTLIWMILVPLVLLLALSTLAPSIALRFGLCTVAALLGGYRLRSLYLRLSSYSLGFDGERLVGSELQALERLGYRVFHDIPFDGFNVDHIVVGPRSILVVETKTRRRSMKGDEARQDLISFDGKLLHFPWGADNFGLEQTQRNRDAVAKWVLVQTGCDCKVEGLLVFPGWTVEARSGTSLRVSGHSALASLFPAPEERVRYSDAHLKIVSLLEEKCTMPLSPTKAD